MVKKLVLKSGGLAVLLGLSSCLTYEESFASSNGRDIPSASLPKVNKKTTDKKVQVEDTTVSSIVSGTRIKGTLASGAVVSMASSSKDKAQPIVMVFGDQKNPAHGWKSKLKGAVMIGSCYWDLSSKRAMCPIHSFSFVKPNGEVIEKQIEGWIIGSDGKLGLRGKVVDRVGSVAREAFVAGMFSVLGDFFKISTQSSVFPLSPLEQSNALKSDDVLKTGTSQGVLNTLGKLTEFSIRRAQSMEPVLVLSPGMVVDVVFKKGFDLSPTTGNSITPLEKILNPKGEK